MAYDFKTLSFADFEDLTRDLIGAELNVRFEAFCPGPDGGVDGRHAPIAKGKVILQAKHYEGSPFSKLKATMKSERKSINALAPDRYILATSCKFTPPSKADLAAIIGPSLKGQGDIYGPEDLNGLLRKYPDILKSHIKLWLSGTGVLERVLRAAADAFSNITLEDIEQKVRVYAANPSFDQSLAKLEKHHVLIISGPPGVGKTTLAEMLCYTFLGEDWALIPIRSLDDGFAAIKDSCKQIFLFDDFLGRVALDKDALSHTDSDLARFMSRVRRSKNARFILTTRGYIFEEARNVSEHLGDQSLDVTKYVLDVGIYTRRIKARILYNHLSVAGTPKPYVRALIDSETLPSIVDHKNYNPRVIEAMTDIVRIGDLDPDHYPKAFVEALNKPHQIWDKAFRSHIDQRCRHLLFALFFSSEFGTSISELRGAYESVHAGLSVAYGHPRGPKDFEEALRILEGSFVKIEAERVSFLNPSLRDYLSSYLDDADLLQLLAPTARSIDWIRSLWTYVERTRPAQEHPALALLCAPLADMFTQRRRWRQSPRDPGMFIHHDASNATRLKLLLTWWQLTDDLRFADAALAIARAPVEGFSAWQDSDTLLSFFKTLTDRDYGRAFVHESEFLSVVEEAVIELIRWSSGSDALSSIAIAIDEAGEAVPASVMAGLEAAVLEEFAEIAVRVEEEENETALKDRIAALEKFAPRYNIPSEVLAGAVKTIESRIATLNEQTSESNSPSVRSAPARPTDKFSNDDLKNLFAPLLDD